MILRLSERKVLLFAADLLAVEAALLLVLAWRFHMPLAWRTVVDHVGWFATLAAAWAILAPVLNTYDLRRSARVLSGAAAGLAAAGLVGLVYLAVPYITPPLNASRLTAASFLVTSGLFVALGRAAYARVLAQPTFRHRAIVLGAGPSGQAVAEALRVRAGGDYDVVGFLDDGLAPGVVVAGLPVLGSPRELRRVVRADEVSEVVVAVGPAEPLDGELQQALIDSHEQGVQVTGMASLYERLTGKVPVEHIGTSLHLILPVDQDPSRLYLIVKRGIDIVIGLLGTLATGLLVPIVWLASRLDGRGPLFYRQSRVGRGGRPFSLLKFRTMVPDAESQGPQWAQVADARITRAGRVLRRLHVDEVPQAINILRGEMSFIGPRPERPEFVAGLARQIPFYRARHALRPGVTGWAQVNYGYGDSTEDALIKLQYDLYYCKHVSLYLDVLILLRTLSLLLSLKGR